MNDDNIREDHRDPTKAGRRDYDKLDKELRDYVRRTDRRLHRFFVGALIAVAFIGISTAFSLGAFGLILKDRANNVAKIQKQREDFILRDCLQTNRRHDDAVDKLMIGSDLDQKNAPNAAIRKEIRRRRDVTIGLIDVLVPKTVSCKKLVQQSVQEIK